MKNYILKKPTPYGVLGFYKKDQNKHLSFEVIGDKKLTQKLIKDCKQKTVKLENISYAIKGLKDKLERLTKGQVMVTISLDALNTLLRCSKN